jgi:hypothetical protein
MLGPLEALVDGRSVAFPGVPASLASSEFVTGYRDAVEAILLAFENADGSSARPPAELRRLPINLLGGPVRLDKNRQAVISTSPVRIGDPGGAGAQPTLTPVSRQRGAHGLQARQYCRG